MQHAQRMQAKQDPFADIIQHTRGLAALREPAAFALACVGEDGLSVAWSPELEISARRLWQLATEQTSDSRAEFRDWLQRASGA